MIIFTNFVQKRKLMVKLTNFGSLLTNFCRKAKKTNSQGTQSDRVEHSLTHCPQSIY